MFTMIIVGLSGGVFGILGYEAARYVAGRMRGHRAHKEAQTLFSGLKPLPGYLPPGLYHLPGPDDTCGIPIHELDNVDTAPIPVSVLRANVGRSR